MEYYFVYTYQFLHGHLTERQRVRKVKTKGFTGINQKCSEEISKQAKGPCTGDESVVYKLHKGPFS